MELIKEIIEKDIGFSGGILPENKYQIRKRVSAVIFNENNEIVLLDVSNEDYHMLPGGHIEDGENNLAALRREVLEETGYEIDNIKELGFVKVYGNKTGRFVTTYAYLGKTLIYKQKPAYTAEEINAGMKIVWFKIEKAIEVLLNDNPMGYIGKFIRLRELAILTKAQKE